MGNCSRVIIAGTGNVELDFGQATGQVLVLAPGVHFGVLSTDTYSSPKPVPANRLIVNVYSNAYGGGSSSAAVYLGGGSGGDEYGSGGIIAAGTFNAPNGQVNVHTGSGESSSGGFYGSVSANLLTVSGIVHEDASGATGGAFTNFTNLRSWKDQ